MHRLANGIVVVKLSTDEKNVECALTVRGSSNNLVIVRNGGTCHPYEICITDLPIARNVCFPEDVIHLKEKKIQLNQQRKTGEDKITGLLEYLSKGQPFAPVLQQMAQLPSRNRTPATFVTRRECINDLVRKVFHPRVLVDHL